jgi:HD-like signal output (HDOD) protein
MAYPGQEGIKFRSKRADGNIVSASFVHRVPYRDLALRGLDQLPPFSPVLNHLMASLADENVSFSRLASVIECDTVLSGNVLRLVNSALYGRRGTVSSVRAAILILGIVKLRKYLLGMSVSRLFAKVKVPAGWEMARFNDHSVAVALLADLIVQKGNFQYPEGAFAAGLLHDLGRLMIATALLEESVRIREEYASGDLPLEQVETSVLETAHSELSAAALARWGLPAPIQKAVLYHHRSIQDPSAGEQQRALSSAVQAADQIANGMGISIMDADARTGRSPEEALDTVGLAGCAESLQSEFTPMFEEMHGNL